MKERVTSDDHHLLDALGVDTTTAAKPALTPREQRILAGFEEIKNFTEQHNRPPANLPGADIFERMMAVRLDAIRHNPECLAILRGVDDGGLLDPPDADASVINDSSDGIDDAELLAALGTAESAGGDVTYLKHVRTRDQIRAAEEIAQRTPCADFDVFRPAFLQVQADLQSGARTTRKFEKNADVNECEFFILDGQKVFVAVVGEKFINDYDRPDRRLRLIYDNGTESDLLLRSFQRALYKDKTSRRITAPEHGPLFAAEAAEGDTRSGWIYVLRSLSEHPFIAENREVIHKIGVTGGSVEKRIANAKKDPTFLMADVEIVATYELVNIDRTRLERLLHRFFAPARLDLELKDRFGLAIEPREWFLAPQPTIREAIEKLMEGTLQDYRYDPETAGVIRA